MSGRQFKSNIKGVVATLMLSGGVWAGGQLFNWWLPKYPRTLHVQSVLSVTPNIMGALLVSSSQREEEFVPLSPVPKYWCRGSVLARQHAYSGCSSAYQWDRGCNANPIRHKTKMMIHLMPIQMFTKRGRVTNTS